MKIGILGSGMVALALAKGFAGEGHEVMLGTRDTLKVKEFPSGSFEDAAAFGELLVLAVKGSAARIVLESAKVPAGTIVIDPTNPIADEAPEKGVLRFFTSPNTSLMEQMQEAFPTLRFVKAFSCVGAPHMVRPNFESTPTMFICGNDADAKTQVAGIVKSFGFDVEDMGSAEAARAIEPLCILWCIPGFLRNEWNHAFKLLKK